ncbi:LOW QUALITY PROTEIN: jacalin-related lectin 24 [Capsella rubella]|uniref:LOW QUALITY PROTEIN: jacalin-related lectin 24 n=1 Tax=Capsella rubella TaxID=81985 RepID=UPI000CD5430D|nr:LOW QUALITY PROTEIN: jacalin-related lectin 24 [Capsella rubella]
MIQFRKRKMFKVGPIGSKLFDTSWDEKDEKGRNMISNIYVAFNKYKIHSIQFSYFQKGGHVVSKKYGSSKEGEFSYEIVRLNHDEYVTGLSGICFQGRVTSLTFYTNQRKHGPFCDQYSSNSLINSSYKREIDVGIRDRREFGGFFGSYDQYGMSSIGIYVYPTYDNDFPLNEPVRTRAVPEPSEVQHGIKTNYKVTEVTDEDDDQLTLYQSTSFSHKSESTIMGRLNIKCLMRSSSDDNHAKDIVHKFEDKSSLYQKAD